jgi:serine/threonine protein kinase
MIDRYSAISTALTLLSDYQLTRLLAGAPMVATGIGGSAVRLEIEGEPVFAKQIPLTDLEQKPENVMSTANHFGMPVYSQYGVGSPSFGVWRELAASVMTTNWVLSGQCPNFPLLYHWRVLPGTLPAYAEHEDIEQVVERWHGATGIRDRLHAIANASATVVLFSQYLPHNLRDWLASQQQTGIESAALLLIRDLPSTISFMTANGLHHFDAHPGNILTDGERLYLTDFGLATSPRFDLSAPERGFLDLHRNHEQGYIAMQIMNWLATALTGATTWPGKFDRIKAWAQNRDLPAASAPIIKFISGYAAVAAIMNDFYWSLHTHSRLTPYPASEVDRLIR